MRCPSIPSGRSGMSLRAARTATVLVLFLISALPSAAVEGWLPGPGMSIGRYFFALVPLPSGDLLAPGGVAAGPGYTNRVDLFSVAGRSFSETMGMQYSHRYQPMAILLGNGKVLIAGEQYDGAVKQSLLFTEAT